ncbi:3-keto-5-aminohexanoate cleavage protein [Ornithinimicrobium ciconiae]|uniref:3-keto-5-aminohexanoate cleavage protein n=1 Tax=Ornithinimicrobium ciconiae TaxID=2594265 RepID=A0A516GCU3_9MICO|nr:3-keto-5-aminohexanoate cleavage protein [Ornithinimicrobium ciconiae]QDO89346.1 3-keto-5-aminohexanoate cleavage protein [Ornithinimicrobium ciconiae]
MRRTSKTFITCAVTGSIHTPTMSDYLPVTPQEIGDQAIDAAQAGAAILHLHARDPQDGRPSPAPAVFEQFLPRIHEQTDAIINITTGGSTAMTVQERLAAALRFEPELASLNMGSINFVFSGAAAKFDTWKHDWEKDYLLGSEDRIFANTFRQIEYTLRELGEERGTRFEFECYDVGHLYTLAHFVDRGLVKPPFMVQSIFGILGGIGADHDNLTHMVTVADRLFGDDYILSAFAAGRHQMEFVTHAALLGGQVRVGLEDSLSIARGERATSNAQQVEKVAGILQSLGHELAGPDEVRDILALKGKSAVKI